MKTIGEFFAVISDTKNQTALILIQIWRSKNLSTVWKQCEDLPLTMNEILLLRRRISILFEECYASSEHKDRPLILDEHRSFIAEFDQKAYENYRFIITSPRRCISMDELMNFFGLIAPPVYGGYKLRCLSQQLKRRLKSGIQNDNEGQE
ncbi:MAG: hypothetical protein V4438_00900 [Patescibacteria group bacterium]